MNKKPNILVIMLDDLGYNDLAIYNGNSAIHTPNLDRIARQGMRFTRHYAASSCSPARAAFLTGMYPERLGYLPNGRGISSDIVTLPERLRAAGYTTWHFGKWHIGDLYRTAWPDQQGFDDWFGYLNPFFLAGKQSDGALQLKMPRYVDPWLQGGAERGRFYPGHLEDVITDRAIETITALQADDAPWFVNLWFFAPHAPIQPARAVADRYPATPAGRYRALVHQLDANIGRILLHLESLGAMDNTIVVVISDNGGTNKEVDNNAPFYGRKAQLTEGGLRTPLIVLWPDQSLRAKVVADTISIEDIYPTLLSAIGLSVPEELDGVSYYSALRGKAPMPHKPQIRESNRDSYSVLSADGRWRLTKPPTTWGRSFPPQLYDLEADSTGEQWINASASQLLPLKELYAAWYKDVHVVRTRLISDGASKVALSGMDLLRTPGFGGYTIGFGLPHDYVGLMAHQGDIWSIKRVGNTIEAAFGNLLLTGELVTQGSCHSVVITGKFGRQLAPWSSPDYMSLALWIDGKPTDVVKLEGTLSVPDPSIVTTIGESGGAAMAPPVILNTRLGGETPWTLDAFSDALCERRPLQLI